MAKRSAERSAACATCGKTFARSDTLLRHEKSHHATEDRGPLHRVTNGTFRACCVCAQARSRCSGGMPCGRCKTRSLNCIYPNKRRRGNNNNTDDDGQMSFDTTVAMDMSTASPGAATKLEHQFAGQFQQFVFSPAASLQFTNDGQSGMSTVDPSPEVSRISEVPMNAQQAAMPHSRLPTDLPVATPIVQQLSPMEANLQGIAGIPTGMPGQTHFDTTTVAIDYQNQFNSQQAALGSSDMYDPSMNLNWIPLSIYPSPYGDIEQDFSFLLPTLSDTASMSNDFDPLQFDGTLGTTSQGNKSQRMQQSSRYQPPASISGLMRSPTSTGSDNVAPSAFGYDKLDIPSSRSKRRKSSHAHADFSQPKETQTNYAFPDMSALASPMLQPKCPESKYASVAVTFQKLCVNSSRWKPFATSSFPGPVVFNACIDLYFEYMHPSFPLLHAPTFARSSDWLTCLAAAALGATFAAIPNCSDAQEAFQEFLRRAVLATADEHDSDFRNVHLSQARVLALIGLTQSNREQLRSRAPRSHADIARWCLESSILQLTAPDEEVRSDEDIEAAWDRWVQCESLRRVGYFIWYLDCALAYIGNARPLCNMDDARAPLPCSELLWNAASAQEWLIHRNNTPRTPSLCAALETMYNNKRIDPGLSEISQILLIHALYSRTWEVGTHIKQPLSEWKPTGNSRGFLNTPSKDNFWLPVYPLYANWRNSACDCLDILHWQATATQARNSGAEHHGILHLHLARVILLTPFQEIQDLLFFLINHRVSDLSKASFYVHDGSYQPRNPAKLPQIRKITWRWLQEDQHKARLAIIHAGSVFWHVRRFSTYSFFEPLAVYLASIVLWTYGSYKSSVLGRDTAGTTTNGKSANLRQQASDNTDINDRSNQTQPEPGIDANVQPTRVERAAHFYTETRSHSSPSRSAQDNITNRSDSPAISRSQQQFTIAPESRAVPSTNTNSSSRQHPTAANSISTTQQLDDSEGGTTSSDDDQPQFIYLDRPCDDEIVQHFVRNGHNISGYMSNVGDICKTPSKVLVEGAKILRTKLGCWGVSREYHDILIRLAERGEDHGKSKERHRSRRGE